MIAVILEQPAEDPPVVIRAPLLSSGGDTSIYATADNMGSTAAYSIYSTIASLPVFNVCSVFCCSV